MKWVRESMMLTDAVAGATTKHQEDVEKGLSDASKMSFLNKKLIHVQ